MKHMIATAVMLAILSTGGWGVVINTPPTLPEEKTTKDEESIRKGDEALARMDEICRKAERECKQEKAARIIIGIGLIGIGVADIVQDDAVSAFSGASAVTLGVGLLTYKF